MPKRVLLFLTLFIAVVAFMSAHPAWAQAEQAYPISIKVTNGNSWVDVVDGGLAKVYDSQPWSINVTVYNGGCGFFGGYIRVLLYADDSLIGDLTQYIWRGFTGVYRWHSKEGWAGPATWTVTVKTYWVSDTTLYYQDGRSFTFKIVKLSVTDWSPSALTVQRGLRTATILSIGLKNGGNDDMYGVSVSVVDSAGLQITPQSQSLGDIVTSGTKTTTFSVIAPSTVALGSYTILFRVSYRDFRDVTHTEDKTASAVVTKMSTKISLSHLSSVKLGETLIITARLVDGNNDPLQGQSIRFYLGQNLIGAADTDSSGNAVINYRVIVEAGRYQITSTYGGSPDYLDSQATSTLIANPLALTISTPYGNMEVIAANGTWYTTDAVGKVKIAITKLGSYNVEVKTPVLVETGIRGIFTKWMDDVTSNPRTIVMSEDLTLTAAYKTQYYLSVKTVPLGITTISGEGWYDSGTSTTTGTASATVGGATGTQYVFLEWVIDDVSQPGNPVSIVMNAPHRAVAKYKTQYYLTVRSDYGNPQGERWYDAGSTATFSVTSPVGIGAQQVFTGWTGDSTATTTTATIVMNGPKTVSANWRTDYTQLYMIIAAIAVIGAIATIALTRRRKSKS